jgi:hypothetical protein
MLTSLLAPVLGFCRSPRLRPLARATESPRKGILNVDTLVRTLVLVALGIGFGLLLTPRESEAQLGTVFATRLFTTDSNQSNGLAFDVSSPTEHLYIADNAAQFRVYTLDGSLLRGPISLPGDSSANELGLHFVREATSLGGEAVPAGTLTFFRGGAGGLSDPSSIHAIDKVTGFATASQPLITNYNTGQPCRPLRNRGTGLGFSTRRDLFLSVDPFCTAIAEVSGGEVTGHFDWPGAMSGQNQGDVKEHPTTGHLWVGSPVPSSTFTLAQFTETGTLLREFQIIDADTELNILVSRLAFDATGERLFILLGNGDVYQASGTAISLPALSGPAVIALFAAIAVAGSLAARRFRKC